jgi:hypothetical protein
MKAYVHARLGAGERQALERLKRATGRSESDLLRHGLRLVQAEVERPGNALEAAGASVGRFRNGPPDLSTASLYLDDFGR